MRSFWTEVETFDQPLIPLDAAATMIDLGSLVVLILIACVVIVIWILIAYYLVRYTIRSFQSLTDTLRSMSPLSILTFSDEDGDVTMSQGPTETMVETGTGGEKVAGEGQVSNKSDGEDDMMHSVVEAFIDDELREVSSGILYPDNGYTQL